MAAWMQFSGPVGLQVLSSAPSTGHVGQTYYDSTKAAIGYEAASGYLYTASLDANSNFTANNVLAGYTTTATAAGTTTLVVGSTYNQYFTGTTTQTVTLPVTSTLVLGWAVRVVNKSTGIVTVNSSGGNAVLAVPARSSATFSCILTSGTNAASWDAQRSGFESVIRVGNGTQTAPGVSFANQTGTGLWLTSDNDHMVANYQGNVCFRFMQYGSSNQSIDLLPMADNTYDLGQFSYTWRNLFSRRFYGRIPSQASDPCYNFLDVNAAYGGSTGMYSDATASIVGFSVTSTELLRLGKATQNALITGSNASLKVLVAKAASSSTSSTFEAQSSGGTPYVTIGPPTLAGDSLYKNFLNVTGTLPTTLTDNTAAVFLGITSAGSSSQIVSAQRTELYAGYTGSNYTITQWCSNTTTGTGSSFADAGAANYAVYAAGQGAAATGANVGVCGNASASSVWNVGIVGTATVTSGSGVKNIGVFGNANSGGSAVGVGGYFCLSTSSPSVTSAALVCDNAATTDAIFVARDNGTAVFSVLDGGTVVHNSAAISTSATAGFLYIAGCAGTPSGTPTSYSGRSPLVVDTTNNLLYFYSGGAWRSAGGGGGSGTVTSVSVVSANGFAGSVATSTSTPAITLTTTVTGVLKGNGTAVSAATAGTDYSAGTSALATGILKSTTSTGNLTIAVAADFPTLNQNTTGSAASLSVSGQTGLITLTGITSTNRAKTVRDAADTILELGGSYTPSGTWTSLTLVTPVLGTPTSGTLTNCTGLPVATGISGLGTGIATFLATPTSANLAAAVTNETGSGALVFGTSPTLTAVAVGAVLLTDTQVTVSTAATKAAAVSNKALTSNVATLTTSAAHGFVTGETVVVTGVDSTFNGTFVITATGSSTTFSYAKTASNVTSAAVSPAGAAIVGQSSAAQVIKGSGQTYAVSNKALTSNVATLTATGHNFQISQTVIVTGVGAPFDGTWTVTAVATNTFSFACTNSNVTSAAVSPAGVATAHTQRGDYLQLSRVDGTNLTTFDKDGFGFPMPATFLLAVGSAATTGTNLAPLLRVPRGGKIVDVSINAKTAPTGAALIVDINLNGTSIWATNQSNRVQLAASATSGTQTSFDTTSVAAGDLLTIDIDQVGSTIAGQDVTVELTILMKNQL